MRRALFTLVAVVLLWEGYVWFWSCYLRPCPNCHTPGHRCKPSFDNDLVDTPEKADKAAANFLRVVEPDRQWWEETLRGL